MDCDGGGYGEPQNGDGGSDQSNDSESFDNKARDDEENDYVHDCWWYSVHKITSVNCF